MPKIDVDDVDDDDDDDLCVFFISKDFKHNTRGMGWGEINYDDDDDDNGDDDDTDDDAKSSQA